MNLHWIALALGLCLGDEKELVVESFPGGGRIEYEVIRGEDGEAVHDGAYTAYGANGKKSVLGKFSAGLRSGRWNYRFADGKPWVTGSYQEGQRHGKWSFRYPNREVRAEGSYSKGDMRGEWSFFDESGEVDPRLTGTYETITELNRDGSVAYSGRFLDGTLHGPWFFYWPSGKIQLTAQFHRGQRVGPWRFWHAEGTADSKMLSKDYPGGTDFVELNAEPILLPPFPNEAAAKASMPRGGEANPNLLEPLEGALENSKARGDMSKFRRGSEAERTESREWLVEQGRDVLPSILEELRVLDYAKPEDVGFASRVLMEIVRPIFGGHALLIAGQEQDAAAVRLAVLRAYGLYSLLRDTRLWWSLDLHSEHHAQEEGDCPLLMFPPSPAEARFGSGNGARVYEWRFQAKRDGQDKDGKGTAPALSKALKWLADHQNPDGSWSSESPYHDVGVTSLALLAFMGDGNSMTTGPYRPNVEAAAAWLISQQDRETGRFRKLVDVIDPTQQRRTQRYSNQFHFDHALATQALCELSSFSTSFGVRSAARRAVAYIVRSRNPYGVWRYESPPVGDNDTAVTVMMAEALIAAKRAGISLDEATWSGVSSWLDEVTDAATGRVGYSSIGEGSSRYGDINGDLEWRGSEAMTAAGLWCRHLLGQPLAENAIARKHAELLLRSLPERDPGGPAQDFYYWYYGSNAMRAMGGKYYKAWNKALKSALVDQQVLEGGHAGSWVPDTVWSKPGGRVYSTAMAALCLESYYRFNL